MKLLNKETEDFKKIKRVALWINHSRTDIRKEDNWRGRNSLTEDELQYLYQKYEGVCYGVNGVKCGAKTRFFNFNVVHVLPIALFPKKKGLIKNLIIVCDKCLKIRNKKVKFKTPIKFVTKKLTKYEEDKCGYIILEERIDKEKEIQSDENKTCFDKMCIIV